MDLVFDGKNRNNDSVERVNHARQKKNSSSVIRLGQSHHRSPGNSMSVQKERAKVPGVSSTSTFIAKDFADPGYIASKSTVQLQPNLTTHLVKYKKNNKVEIADEDLEVHMLEDRDLNHSARGNRFIKNQWIADKSSGRGKYGLSLW